MPTFYLSIGSRNNTQIRRSLCRCGVEAGREVTKRKRLLDDPVRREVSVKAIDFRDHFDDVIDVTLRVHASRYRQPNELSGTRVFFAGFGIASAKHDSTNFHRS